VPTKKRAKKAKGATRAPSGKRRPRRPSTTGNLEPVIDFHVHINPWNRLKVDALKVLERTQPGFEKIQKYIDNPSSFVDHLDAEGIERVALINYVAPEVMGYKQDINQWVHDYAAAAPERLIPFGSLDPLHVEGQQAARRQIEHLLFKLELKGIKIHPPHMLVRANDYQIGGGALSKLYEMCEDERVPIMFHTGTSIFPGARNKFGDPMDLDDVACDFPRLKIVMAHGGRPLWTETAFFLARRHANVWLDISSIPPQNLMAAFPRLEQITDKVIFGSDWPGPGVPSMRANADAVDALDLPTEARRNILYYNALKVIG
jgi:predicted TIM-barrel fold metal-dependent hydrolase